MSVLTGVSPQGPGPLLMDKPHTFGATALSKGPSGSAALEDVPSRNVYLPTSASPYVTSVTSGHNTSNTERPTLGPAKRWSPP